MLKENNQNKPQEDKTIEHLNQEDLILESEDTEESSTDEITGSSSEGQMSPVEERLIRCEILIQQGEFAKAKRLLDWVFNREPTNWKAYRLAFFCDLEIRSLDEGVALPSSFDDAESLDNYKNIADKVYENINYKSTLRFCENSNEKKRFEDEVEDYFVKPASELIAEVYTFMHDNKEFYKYDGDRFIEFEDKCSALAVKFCFASYIFFSFGKFNAEITLYEPCEDQDNTEMIFKVREDEQKWISKVSDAFTCYRTIEHQCIGDFLPSHSHSYNLENVVCVDFNSEKLLLFRKNTNGSSVEVEEYQIDLEQVGGLYLFFIFYNKLLLAFGNNQFGIVCMGTEETPIPAAYSQQITNLKENYIKSHSQTFDLTKENQKLKVGQAKSKEQFIKEAIAAYVGIALFIIAIFIICIVFLH